MWKGTARSLLLRLDMSRHPTARRGSIAAIRAPLANIVELGSFVSSQRPNGLTGKASVLSNCCFMESKMKGLPRNRRMWLVSKGGEMRARAPCRRAIAWPGFERSAVLLCIFGFATSALAGSLGGWGLKSGLGGIAAEQGSLHSGSVSASLRLKGGMDDAAKAARAARAARAKEQAEAAKAAGG